MNNIYPTTELSANQQLIRAAMNAVSEQCNLWKRNGVQFTRTLYSMLCDIYQLPAVTAYLAAAETPELKQTRIYFIRRQLSQHISFWLSNPGV